MRERDIDVSFKSIIEIIYCILVIKLNREILENDLHIMYIIFILLGKKRKDCHSCIMYNVSY